MYICMYVDMYMYMYVYCIYLYTYREVLGGTIRMLLTVDTDDIGFHVRLGQGRIFGSGPGFKVTDSRV